MPINTQQKQTISQQAFVLTFEVIECGEIGIVNSASRRRQSWVPASQHFTQSNKVLYHNGSGNTHAHYELSKRLLHATVTHVYRVTFKQRNCTVTIKRDKNRT